MRQSSDFIRTPDQRLRIYVSGDPARLPAERRAAREAVESLHLTPVTVDVEGAAGRQVATAYLGQSNAFVGVYDPALGEGSPVPDGSLQEFELTVPAAEGPRHQPGRAEPDGRARLPRRAVVAAGAGERPHGAGRARLRRGRAVRGPGPGTLSGWRGRC